MGQNTNKNNISIFYTYEIKLHCYIIEILQQMTRLFK